MKVHKNYMKLHIGVCEIVWNSEYSIPLLSRFQQYLKLPKQPQHGWEISVTDGRTHRETHVSVLYVRIIQGWGSWGHENQTWGWASDLPPFLYQMMLYSYVRISKLVMRMTSIRGDDVNSPSTDKRCHVTSPGIGSDSHEVTWHTYIDREWKILMLQP